MRRTLALVLTVLFVAASGASTGVAHAAVPRTGVRILAGTDCTPAATYCYKKAAKTIASGTKVVWKNLTGFPHTITRCNTAACSGTSGGTGTDTGLGSPTVGSGGRYKFIFHGLGTYTYYCTFHGYAVMHGTVTVT